MLKTPSETVENWPYKRVFHAFNRVFNIFKGKTFQYGLYKPRKHAQKHRAKGRKICTFDAKEKGDKSMGDVLYYICIIIESCQKAVRAGTRGKRAAERRRTGLYPIVLRSNHIADGK